MAIDLEKYRKEPTATGGATPPVDINKYRKTPVQTGSTFNVPQDPAKASQQRLQAAQNDQVALDKEANKGFFSRFGKALVKNIAPSQVGLGKTLAGLLYQGSKTDTGLQESIAQGEQGKIDLLKAIRENEAKGVDAIRLKQAYNEQEKTLAGTTKTARDLVQLPTTAQAVGQIGGTALDLLTAGTYGKAKTGVMSTGRLFTQTPAIKTAAVAVGAPEISNLATQQARGLFSRQGASNIVKGTIPGYASDVTLGLQGERGEDREGANAFIPGLGTALGFGIPALSEAAQTVRNIADPTSGIVEKRMSGLKDLETKNGKIARVFESADRKGVDVRKTLAETNLLNGAIDADGRISSDKALNNFNEFIQPYEGRVKEALNSEGRNIQLNQLADEASDFIDNSKLSDRQKVELQREIADNLDAFKQFRGNTVPVASVHDTKVSLANANNYLNPSKNIVDKEAARFFKEVVEKNTSSIDVAKYNKELSKYYTVREALEAMDRAVVSGGRMGKYFSSLIGTGVGGLAGGPIGAIVGAEAGAKVRGSMMSRAFGGDIKTGLQATPELIDALNPKPVGKQAIPDVIIGKSKSAIPDVVVGSRTAKPVNAVIPVTNTKLQAFKAGQGNSQGGYIVNPFQGKPKQLVDNQDVSSINSNTTPLKVGQTKPNTLDPKNFKTADEFVKAQGGTYYHQSQSKNAFSDFKQKGDIGYKKAHYSQAGEGIYFSPKKDLVTSKYGKDGGILIESVLKPKNKLDLGTYDAMYFDGRKVNSGDIVVENFKRSQQGLPELPEPDILLTGINKKAKSWLEKNGYDAVEGMKGEMYSAPELVVIDKSIIKTKSQLTDIWNKANTPVNQNRPRVSNQTVSLTNDNMKKTLKEVVQETKSAEDFADIIMGKELDKVSKVLNKKLDDSIAQGKTFPTEESIKKAFPKEFLADKIAREEKERLLDELRQFVSDQTQKDKDYIMQIPNRQTIINSFDELKKRMSFKESGNTRVPAEVRSNIVEILDDYTLNGGKNKTLQEDAARIAEDFGITLPKRYGDLVKRLGEFLDKQEINRQVN